MLYGQRTVHEWRARSECRTMRQRRGQQNVIRAVTNKTNLQELQGGEITGRL